MSAIAQAYVKYRLASEDGASSLRSTTRWVWFLLATEYRDAPRVAVPDGGVQAIAELAGLNRGTVLKSLRELEDLGLVERIARHDAKTRAQLPSAYGLPGLAHWVPDQPRRKDAR